MQGTNVYIDKFISYINYNYYSRRHPALLSSTTRVSSNTIAWLILLLFILILFHTSLLALATLFHTATLLSDRMHVL